MPALFDDMLALSRPGSDPIQSYRNVLSSFLCLTTLRSVYKEERGAPPSEVLRYGEYAIMHFATFQDMPASNSNAPAVPLQATLKDNKHIILTPNILAHHERPIPEEDEFADWVDLETATAIINRDLGMRPIVDAFISHIDACSDEYQKYKYFVVGLMVAVQETVTDEVHKAFAFLSHQHKLISKCFDHEGKFAFEGEEACVIRWRGKDGPFLLQVDYWKDIFASYALTPNDIETIQK